MRTKQCKVGCAQACIFKQYIAAALLSKRSIYTLRLTGFHPPKLNLSIAHIQLKGSVMFKLTGIVFSASLAAMTHGLAWSQVADASLRIEISEVRNATGDIGCLLFNGPVFGLNVIKILPRLSEQRH